MGFTGLKMGFSPGGRRFTGLSGDPWPVRKGLTGLVEAFPVEAGWELARSPDLDEHVIGGMIHRR